MDKKKFFVWCAVRRNLSKNSLRHTEVRYRYFFRWLGRRKLNAKNVELFVLHLRQRGLRNVSINSYIRIINLLNIYTRENGKDLNLLRKVNYFPKQRTVPTILTMEEIEKLLSVDLDYNQRPYFKLNSEKLNRNYKLFTWIMVATGCRYEEAASLTKDKVSLGITDGSILFTNTKTRLDRRVPIPPILVGLLREHLKDKKPADLCFTTSMENHIPQQCYNPDLRRRAEKAGLSGKHIHAHCFRNSYIMAHIRAGTDVITIAHLVGHEDLSTTMGYTKYNYDDLLRGAENHPLFSLTLSTDKIFARVGEVIEKLPVNYDTRFETKITKTRDRLVFELSPRKVLV